MKRFSLVYLILGTLTAAAEIVLVTRWTIPGQVEFGSNWKFLIPPAVCGAAYLLARKYPRPLVHATAMPVCVLICAAWLSLIVFAHGFQMALAPVTDTGQYQTILNTRWNLNGDFTAHFPRPIPRGVQDVRFYYQPAFGQGAEIIQLRYRTTPAEISELYDRFAALKTKASFGGENDLHMNEPEGMPTTSFWTSGSDDRRFPLDFEIMIFDKLLMEKDWPEGFYWNHGSSHGVAISKQRNEIVYWAERW
jgi:hypothetical protein